MGLFLYVIEARMYKKNLAFFIIKHKCYLIHEIVHFLSHHFHKHSPYNVKFANMVLSSNNYLGSHGIEVVTPCLAELPEGHTRAE